MRNYILILDSLTGQEWIIDLNNFAIIKKHEKGLLFSIDGLDIDVRIHLDSPEAVNYYFNEICDKIFENESQDE